MDLVIPLGDGSIWNNWELRYALRSWAKHFPRVRPLVVGHVPRWYTGDNYPFVERHMLNANTNAKLLAVLDRLTPTFIWSADDIYLLDTPQWGPFHLEVSPENRHSYYRRALPPGRDHELHIPTRFNRDRMRSVLALMPAPKKLALRSCYFQGYRTSTPMEDVKVPGAPPDGWWCFSSEEGSPYRPAFKQFLQSTFPDPSPWERMSA
jgi:hypothetical protein